MSWKGWVCFLGPPLLGWVTWSLMRRLIDFLSREKPKGRES